MTNFSDKVKKDEINRKKRIVELSQKASLTEKEQKELKKHQEIDNFNHEKARAIDRIPSAIEFSASIFLITN
jgi:hypothetical protein